MKNKKLYIFIGKMALEFRLSLDNVCKILGKENNETIKLEIYKNICDSIDNNYEILDKFKYLFFCETINERETVSRISYERAANFIKRYNKLTKEGTKEEIITILEELNKTEKDFEKVKNKLGKENLTKEEIDIITRYRIKNVIPRSSFSQYYGINRTSLEKRDKFTTNEILRDKLELLSGYFYDIRSQKMKSKK